ncbi:hypothetical protein [Actinomadura rifamycini]|uniref:hypothetical protein n=1 Tax=Actinomadura rifamycini TaxID=31962 RepID=UPI0003F789A8|nr:hypothetical protein [Actinomadura rifamycini]
MSKSALALALAAGLVAVPAAPAAAQAGPVCAGSPAPTFGTATQNLAMNAKFTDYGNSNARLDDWTGGDTTYSLKLSDGRIVFAYSDTFLGKVNADGSRSPVIEEGGTTPFINNSFVVQGANGALSTVTGGTSANPEAPMPPPQAAHWYWAGDLTQRGSEVQQLYREYYDPDPGNGTSWDLTWKRNVLARFSTADLSDPTSVQAMPSAIGVQWGSALLKDGGNTYIYGTEDYTDPDTQQNTKYLHIAKVSGDDLRGQWSYRTAGGWSTREADSVRQMSGVSNEFSVTRRGAHYIMVNQDTEYAFGAEIDISLACSADGPFTDERTVYTTPETGSWPDVYTYNAHQHASLSSSGNLVISYNVNTLDTAEDDGVNDNYQYASIYRPRYVNVPVSG